MAHSKDGHGGHSGHGHGHGTRQGSPGGAPGMLPQADFQASVELMQDRIDYAMARAIGARITVLTSEGDAVTGTLRAAREGRDAEYDVIIENPTVEYDANLSPLTDFQKSQVKPFATPLLTVNRGDIVRMEFEDVELEPSFQTDAAISRSKAGKERELTRWQPEETPSKVSLEPLSGNGSWDQFKTNREMFNVTPSFDENLYTTTLNTSGANFESRKAEATRIAREIESQGPGTNHHQAEERGHIVEGIDDEDKYSGVHRASISPSSNNASSNKLMSLIKKNPSIDKLSTSPPKSKASPKAAPKTSPKASVSPKEQSQSPKSAPKEQSQSPKPVPRDSPKPTPKDSPKPAPKESAKATSKDAAKDLSKDLSKDSLKNLAKDAPKLSPKNTPKVRGSSPKPAATKLSPPSIKPQTQSQPQPQTKANKFDKFNFKNDSFVPTEKKTAPAPIQSPPKTSYQQNQMQAHVPNQQQGHLHTQHHQQPHPQQRPQYGAQNMNAYNGYMSAYPQSYGYQVPVYQPMMGMMPQMSQIPMPMQPPQHIQKPASFLTKPPQKKADKILEGKFNFLLSAKKEFLVKNPDFKEGTIPLERPFDSASWNVSSVRLADYLQPDLAVSISPYAPPIQQMQTYVPIPSW